MDMNMREKMARAIIKDAGVHPDHWRPMLPTVDAILAAMREPTEEMVEAGWGNYETAGCPREVWQAMIDSIRAGK